MKKDNNKILWIIGIILAIIIIGPKLGIDFSQMFAIYQSPTCDFKTNVEDTNADGHGNYMGGNWIALQADGDANLEVFETRSAACCYATNLCGAQSSPTTYQDTGITTQFGDKVLKIISGTYAGKYAVCAWNSASDWKQQNFLIDLGETTCNICNTLGETKCENNKKYNCIESGYVYTWDSGSLLMGQCGVECLIDSDCAGSYETCSSYICEVNQDALNNYLLTQTAANTMSIEEQAVLLDSLALTISEQGVAIGILQTDVVNQAALIDAMTQSIIDVNVRLDTQANLIDGLTYTISNINDILTIQAALISNLQTDVSNQAILISGLQTTTANQATLIANIQTTISGQADLISALRTDVDGQADLITALTSRITNAETQLTTQAGLITALQTTTDNQAALINAMDLSLSEKQALIDTLGTRLTSAEQSISAQATEIDALDLTVQEQADYIAGLDLTVQEQAELISQLDLTLGQRIDLISALSDEMKLTLDDQATLINEASQTIEEQALLIQALNITPKELVNISSKLTSNIDELGAKLKLTQNELEAIKAQRALDIQQEQNNKMIEYAIIAIVVIVGLYFYFNRKHKR